MTCSSQATKSRVDPCSGGVRRITKRRSFSNSAVASGPAGTPGGMPRSSSLPFSPTERAASRDSASSHCARPPMTRPQRAAAWSVSASPGSDADRLRSILGGQRPPVKIGLRQASTTSRSGKLGCPSAPGRVSRSRSSSAAMAGFWRSGRPSTRRIGSPNSDAIWRMWAGRRDRTRNQRYFARAQPIQKQPRLDPAQCGTDFGLAVGRLDQLDRLSRIHGLGVGAKEVGRQMVDGPGRGSSAGQFRQRLGPNSECLLQPGARF